MIDPEAFATGMGLLCGNHSRTLDDAVAAMYYAELSAELSTDEFLAAVHQHIRTEPAFWPPVAKLLEHARTAKGDATHALAHVRAVFARAGGPQFLTAEQYRAEIDDPTHRALWAAGGPSAVLDAKADVAVVQAFAEAYRAARRVTPDISWSLGRAPVARLTRGDT